MTASPVKQLMMFSRSPTSIPEITPLPTVMISAPKNRITPMMTLLPLWRKMLRHAILMIRFMLSRFLHDQAVFDFDHVARILENVRVVRGKNKRGFLDPVHFAHEV